MIEADLEQVLEIDRLSFNLPWPLSAFQYELRDNPFSMLLVAELEKSRDERAVVGLIVVWLIIDEAHIATLSVHPDYRRSGVASAILSAALREAVQRGMHLATLEVRAGNLPAQALYAGFNFKVVGRRVRYYRDNNEDALIMTVSGLDGGIVIPAE
jgi:ribosomal-protein-alanine N-acetyltransferase